MTAFSLEGYLLLIRVEILLQFDNIRSIHELVRKCSVGFRTELEGPTSAELCHAMDLACVFYVKEVLCLQRSAATALLLRRYGFPADMVIGAQMLPFKAHAWVEINNAVVNDKPYMSEIYTVLERC
jgi:Transglutaminase-like superfamily